MILARLREETREQHQQLERVVNLPSRLSSLESYKGLLETFYGVYQPLELSLAANSQLMESGLAENRLHKHLLLERDLISLGHSVEAVGTLQRCSQLPEMHDVYSAAGCLYVLEGSTLGGQFVHREVDRRLNLGTEFGCLFFDSYGARVRQMWASFCSRLEVLAAKNPGRGGAIVKGARDTFTCVEEWMR